MNDSHVFHNNYVRYIYIHTHKSSNMQDQPKLLQRLHHTNLQSTMCFWIPKKPSHCWPSLIVKANLISSGSETVENNPNIGFRSLRKQFKFIVLHDFGNIGFRSLQKQFKFIAFRDFRKQSQHWLSLLAKVIQIHWFSRLQKWS